MSGWGLVAAAALAATSATAAPASRGQHIAQRDCAMCHAVAAAGRSPNGSAPPFRQIGQRYNPIALERTLRTLATKGHFEMRPQRIADADIPELAAYIESTAQR